MKENFLKNFITLLEKNKEVTIFLSHLDPDAVASAFGMEEVLKRYEVRYEICVSSDLMFEECEYFIEQIGFRYRQVNAYSQKGFLILLDSSNPKDSRLQGIVLRPDVIIDHHRSEYKLKCSDKLFLIDENVGAASVLIFQILNRLRLGISKLMATALAFGIYTDTRCLAVAKSDDVYIYTYLKTICDRDLLEALLNFSVKKNAPSFSYSEREKMKICSSDELLSVSAVSHLVSKADELSALYPESIVVVAGKVKKDDGKNITILKVRSGNEIDLPVWMRKNIGSGGGAKLCQNRWYGGIQMEGDCKIIDSLIKK